MAKEDEEVGWQPLSLFRTCLRFLGRNVHNVDSLEDFPEDIGRYALCFHFYDSLLSYPWIFVTVVYKASMAFQADMGSVVADREGLAPGDDLRVGRGAGLAKGPGGRAVLPGLSSEDPANRQDTAQVLPGWRGGQVGG